MYSFHEAISHVQEMEEEVLDSHKAVIEVSKTHHIWTVSIGLKLDIFLEREGGGRFT